MFHTIILLIKLLMIYLFQIKEKNLLMNKINTFIRFPISTCDHAKFARHESCCGNFVSAKLVLCNMPPPKQGFNLHLALRFICPGHLPSIIPEQHGRAHPPTLPIRLSSSLNQRKSCSSFFYFLKLFFLCESQYSTSHHYHPRQGHYFDWFC